MSIAANPFIEHEAEFKPAHDGEQWKFKFRNGYGASVIRHSFSYGGQSGLWELGVLGPDNRLTYETPITNDVEGHLSDDDVRDLLRRVAELPELVSS